MPKNTADVEVWALDAKKERSRVGWASTIRGVRTLVRRRAPNAVHVELQGTADVLDRANGLSMRWSQSIDLVTRDVPISYVILKEDPRVG